MKYIVMEIYDSYVILMDEKAGFVKAKNLGYELGQTIEDPDIIRGIDKYKGVITTVVACVTTMAAALVMVLTMAYYVSNNETSDDASGGMNIEAGYTEPSGDEVNSTTIEAEVVDGEITKDKEEATLVQDETTEERVSDIEDVTVENDTIGIMLESEAKAICLADAGYEEKDVRYIRIVGDIVDGRQIYELEFKVGTGQYRYTYEYKINAYNGDILEVECDKYQEITGNVSQLEEEEIKRIVLADMKESDVDENSVVFKRIQLWYNNDYVKDDENDALYRYSVKIKVDGLEYRYEMNAVTGKILKKIVK